MSYDASALISSQVRAILTELGVYGRNPEVSQTPDRFAELLIDRFKPRERERIRALPSTVEASGPIVIGALPFHALCAHHIVPFFGTIDIAYQPGQKIAGFGAFPRLVDTLSRGPQLQEKLAEAIASAIEEDLQPRGVLVRVRARQMCMELTGSPGASHTVVFAARGVFAGAEVARHAADLFGPPTP